MGNKVNIASLSRKVVTEGDAYAYLERLRWGDNPTCAHCAGNNVYLIAAGKPRATRTGAISERRVWNCRDCRKQFSVLTNTVMHGTKVPVRTWLLVIFEMCASKNGVSARELERKYGLCPRTAWYVGHRVREAMRSQGGLMAGTIVSDETWIGGNPANRHKSQRRRNNYHRNETQTTVMSLICKDTGEARSTVVPDVTGFTMFDVIKANVATRRSHLETDMGPGYRRVGWLFASHETVDHRHGQYVTASGAGTNVAENYFSQLKRSLDGTHHHVSRDHMDRYLAEFDFRYSTRRVGDAERMNLLMARVGRRLTYAMVRASEAPGPRRPRLFDPHA